MHNMKNIFSTLKDLMDVDMYVLCKENQGNVNGRNQNIGFQMGNKIQNLAIQRLNQCLCFAFK